MGVELSALDRMMPKAVKHFWKARMLAAKGQKKRGVADQGNRSGVTAGRNLDGFIAMVRDIIVDNGVAKADVYTHGRGELTSPHRFAATLAGKIAAIAAG